MQSILCQLSKDLSHSVLREWLTWSDLSKLDLAYINPACRELWLSQLSDLILPPPPYSIDASYSSDITLSSYYQWIGSRQVKVECRREVAIRATVLDGLLCLTDCRGIRWIRIDIGKPISCNSITTNITSEVLLEKMSTFLTRCSDIEAIKIVGNANLSIYREEFHLWLVALTQGWKGSSQKVHLGMEVSGATIQPSWPLFRDLLKRHATTWKHVRIIDHCIVSPPSTRNTTTATTTTAPVVTTSRSSRTQEIFSVLFHPSFSSLTDINIFLNDNEVSEDEMIQFFSSHCDNNKVAQTINTLMIGHLHENLRTTDRLCQAILQACPNLERLSPPLLSLTPSTREAQHLLCDTLCQYILTSLSSADRKKKALFIASGYLSIRIDYLTREAYVTVSWNTDMENNEARQYQIEGIIKGLKDHFLVLVSVTSMTFDDTFFTFLKETSSVYLSEFSGECPEANLIDIVKNFPNLRAINMNAFHALHFTDMVLDAIISNIHLSLKKLVWLDVSGRSVFSFSDEKIKELIHACRGLEVLQLPRNYPSYEEEIRQRNELIVSK